MAIRKGSLAVAVAMALGPWCAAAQEAAAARPGPAEPREVEAFMDGVMAATLEAHHVAGATLSVVHDGRVLLAKGYGYADVGERVPVSAESTLFRVGSISKLFVWTAVMQLVEQGRLDLSADVNTYLGDVRIPATYAQPVTLASLLTHTPGFEEHVVSLFARDASSLRPLREILRDEMPARVRPPLDVASYSNHGTGLAAYVVERVSGQPWDDYVEDRILEPLGMASTTFRQPVPGSLAGTLSRGYRFRGGELQEQPFEYVPLAPVGAASTTATDMARFMVAHLHLGRLGDNRVLEESTARTMQSPLFRHAPEVNAMAHGFIDVSANGQRAVGHGGATLCFHSDLVLLPDHGVGLFASLNTDRGARAVPLVRRAFMDHYFPREAPPAAAAGADGRARLARFAGTYRAARYSHSDFTKLAAVVQTLRVVLTDSGELKTLGEEARRYVPTGPLAFRELDGGRTLAFREDARGRITHLFLGDLPMIAFERVPAVDAPALHRALAAGCALLFVTALVFWPGAAWARRHYGVSLPESERVPRLARAVAWLGSLAFAVFLVGLATAFSDPMEVVFGVPAALGRLAAVGVVAALLAASAVPCLVWIWWRHRGSLRGRLSYTLLTLALLAAAWQMQHWNLLRLRY